MSRQVTPLAWALAGKLPGDKSDYRLLACGAPDGDERALAGQVWAAVPSIPQLAGLPGPGALPWVTFVPQPYEPSPQDRQDRPDGQDSHDGGLRWLAVTVTEGTAERDAVGRPAVAVRHVRLAFADVAGASAGYQDLYAAVPSAADLADLRTVTLGASSALRAVASALASPEDFERAARLAALVLDGDAVVTTTEDALLPVAARLAELDRVMALLPYGMRAGLAVATWYDGTAHGGGLPGDTEPVVYQFAYGPFPTRGQAVAPCGAEVPPPGTTTALAYLEELRAARAEAGTVKLVAYLGGYQTALRPDNAEQALEILRSLRDPRRVITAIHDHSVTVEQAAHARQYIASRLHLEERDALDEHLLAHAGHAAVQDILSSWTERSAPLAARALLSRLGSSTQPGQVSQLAQWFYEAAVRSGADEEFLVVLAHGRNSEGKVVPDQFAARLLALLLVPEPGGLPAVRAEVWRRSGLARVLLRQALDGDTVRQAWLDWLVPGPGEAAPEWLPAYPLLVRPRSPHPKVIRQDTLRLYVGLPARGLPLTGPGPTCRQYLDALWELWSQPPLDADRAGLTVGLLQGVHALLEGFSIPGLVDGVVELLRSVVADDRVPLTGDVAEEIAILIAGLPLLMTDPRLNADWWARVERIRPGVRAPDIRLRAAVKDRDASAVDIAVHMGEAAGGGLPPEELLAITAHWFGDGRSITETAAMLQIIEGVVRLRRGDAIGQEAGKYMATLRQLLDQPGEQSIPGVPGTLRARPPAEPGTTGWRRRRTLPPGRDRAWSHRYPFATST